MSTKLTTAEVAARLGVSQPTVKLWCRQGKFPGAALDASSPRGPVWLIPEADLKDFNPPKMGRPPKGKEAAQPTKPTKPTRRKGAA